MSVTGSASGKVRQGGDGRGLLFSLFLLVGLVTTVLGVGMPIFRILDARSWRPTPCTMLSSEVLTYRSNKGTTYKVEVTFAYRVDDERYTSTQYSFVNWSSGSYSAKREIVERLRPGTETTCYVNRRDPTDAVLDRSASWLLLVGVIPAAFAVIGALGLRRIYVDFRKRACNPQRAPST